MTRVCVVGDVLLDRDLEGEAHRLAPDAPVPVVERVRDRARPGGAGLAALLAARSGAEVTLVAALAADDAGRELRGLLHGAGGHFGGGPVGLSTLAVTVGEEADTIEDVYEPYLLQRGFLQRTPRGRVATPHAFRHLGLEPPRPEALFG